MTEIDRWLYMMPWSSAETLMQVTGLSRATVNRRVGRLYEDGLAVSRMVGRRLPATRRWICSRPGLEQHFEFGHGARAHGPHDHIHDPLYPDVEDHRHVDWWYGQAGVRRLYDRLEQLEAFYELLPRLFRGDGRNWLAGGAEASLVGVRFLRRGQLADLVATYEGDIEIVFSWLGRELKPARMMEKWGSRFSHPYLEYLSEAQEQDRRRDVLVEQPDPAFDPRPQLAGNVLVGADEWAVRRAMDMLPRQGYLRDHACSWWVADGRELRQVGQHGLVVPSVDRVADRFEDILVDNPETVAPPCEGDRDDRPAPAALSGVLANRMLSLSEEWPCMLEDDFVDLCQEFRAPVREALAELVAGGLLAQVENVNYYLADPGMIYAARRDGVSVSTIRGRLRNFLTEDMTWHRHYLDHNRGMVRIVRAFSRQGIRVYGGWRGVVHIQGVTQVQPDGVLYADGDLGRGAYSVEHERSATTPQDVLDKWLPYQKAAGAGAPLRVLWVCETKRAAGRFLRLSRGMQAMVTTLDELEAGTLAGPKTVWRSAGGEDLQLWPF